MDDFDQTCRPTSDDVSHIKLWHIDINDNSAILGMEGVGWVGGGWMFASQETALVILGIITSLMPVMF